MLLRPPLRSPLRSSLYAPLVGKFGDVNPFLLFTHMVDYVTPSTVGDVPMNYTNNTNDGRPFREQTNFTACFVENAAGVLVSVPSSAVRRSDRGFWGYPRGTNRCLWNCDLPGGVSAGAWVISNGTDLSVAKDQTGGDNTANSASRITVNVAGGTMLQTVTLAQTNLLFQARAKRLVGTGTWEMTLNGGTTWVDITAQLTSSWGFIFISLDTITNPQFGLRGGTPGDQIAWEFGDVWSTLVSGTQVSRKPQRYYNRQTTTATNVAQSRQAAVSTDNGAWNGLAGSLFLTPYAIYAEFSTEGITGSLAILTGITDTFCTVLPDGSATFAQGGGTSASVPAGTVQFGLDKINKLTAQVDAAGNKQIACNGVNGTDTTGGTFPASLAHIDIWTNGAATRNIFGIGRKIGAAPSLQLTPAQRIQVTS